MFCAGFTHPPHDSLGDDITRRQLGQLVLTQHEPLSVVVDQPCALTAYGFGDQWLLPSGVWPEVKHRGVELHELEIRDGSACPQGHRNAVTGRNAGVRRLRKDLP